MFLDANKIRGGKENVFEFLEEILPLPAHCVERLEIDTQDDLENAKKEIEKGYFDGLNKDFSFADAYNPLDWGGLRYCDARVWSFYNRFNKEYIDLVDFFKNGEKY